MGPDLPGKSTLVENLNLVSPRTMGLIHLAQLEMSSVEDLDDFLELTIDSTSVWANSAWPTDGKLILGLLERVFRMGEELKKYGLRAIIPYPISAAKPLPPPRITPKKPKPSYLPKPQ